MKGANKVAQRRGDGAVKGELCYAKETLLRFPSLIMVQSAY